MIKNVLVSIKFGLLLQSYVIHIITLKKCGCVSRWERAVIGSCTPRGPEFNGISNENKEKRTDGSTVINAD